VFWYSRVRVITIAFFQTGMLSKVLQVMMLTNKGDRSSFVSRVGTNMWTHLIFRENVAKNKVKIWEKTDRFFLGNENRNFYGAFPSFPYAALILSQSFFLPVACNQSGLPGTTKQPVGTRPQTGAIPFKLKRMANQPKVVCMCSHQLRSLHSFFTASLGKISIFILS